MFTKMVYVFILMFVLFVIPTQAMAISPEDAYQRIVSDIDAVDSLVEALDDEDVTADRAIVVANDTRAHLIESSQTYLTIESTDGSIIDAYEDISAVVVSIARSCEALVNSMEEGKEDTYMSAIDLLNANIDEFNLALQDVNKAQGLDSFNYRPLFIGSLILSFLISTGLAVRMFVRRREDKGQFHQFVARDLLMASLWPLVGSLITFVWYEMTPPGGTFYMLWGPVVFGYIEFGRRAYAFYTNKTPEPQVVGLN